MTRESYLKFERQMYKSPYQYINQDNNVLYLSMKKHNNRSSLDAENWTVPYNPIELE